MATYTAQLHSKSGSFAAPDPRDVYIATSLSMLVDILDDWQDEHRAAGSDHKDARLLVWRGEVPDVADVYPDFWFRRGPRGGLVRENC